MKNDMEVIKMMKDKPLRICPGCKKAILPEDEVEIDEDGKQYHMGCK